ncbi:hypothetical protein DL96DRAFT_1612553 [Flagelloscypha sp. PMI_526]|nr:hypothetical protein DL96DRAFT_1612553 [Flagelloscypha sp. PMI_526]
MPAMFSYALSTDEEQDDEIANYERKYLTWVAEPPDSSLGNLSSSSSSAPYLPNASTSALTLEELRRTQVLDAVLATDDLYDILGVSHDSSSLEKVNLRRAYLTRSKACHPDKFPNNPKATFAFQKVAVAYDVLSKPSSRRLYDSRSSSSNYDYFAARPTSHAEETFRGVVLGVINDFLDGDIEVIRTLLKAINDINPALKLGEDGIDSVLTTLDSIRERALTCRTCVYALHAQLSHLVEVQHAFRQLSYFDLLGRSRLTIRLTRITLGLPLAVEKALIAEQLNYPDGKEKKLPRDNRIFPQRLTLLIHALDIVLERVERTIPGPLF